MPVKGQDVRDLLEAYEGAVTLLDNLMENTVVDDDTADFLYLESGEPRVVLSGDV